MTNGHTEEGSYRVTLELTGDQAQQLTRLLDMAKAIDARNIDPGAPSNRMDLVGYRAFLEEMLVLIRDAITDQQPVGN